jgi:hypothetical protein
MNANSSANIITIINNPCSIFYSTRMTRMIMIDYDQKHDHIFKSSHFHINTIFKKLFIFSITKNYSYAYSYGR